MGVSGSVRMCDCGGDYECGGCDCGAICVGV